MVFGFRKENLIFFFFKLVSAKTAHAKLESEVTQEKANAQDLRKMLAEERSVMSTMDMEHQQQLVELEQRHQEKVLHTWAHFRLKNIDLSQLHIFTFLPCFFRFFTSLTNSRTNLSVKIQTKQTKPSRRVQRRGSSCSASKFRFVCTDFTAVCGWINLSFLCFSIINAELFPELML